MQKKSNEFELVQTQNHVVYTQPDNNMVLFSDNFDVPESEAVFPVPLTQSNNNNNNFNNSNSNQRDKSDEQANKEVGKPLQQSDEKADSAGLTNLLTFDFEAFFRIKELEQQKYWLKFKSSLIEDEFGLFFLPKLGVNLCVVSAMFVIDSIIYLSGSRDELIDLTIPIFFLILNAVTILLVRMIKKFQHLQWLSYFVSIVAAAHFAIVSSDETITPIQILFNAIAFMISLETEGENTAKDFTVVVASLFVIHLGLGIDTESGVLAIFSAFTIFYFKYTYYAEHRVRFLAVRLSSLWHDLAQNMSYMEIMVFTYLPTPTPTFIFNLHQSPQERKIPINTSDDFVDVIKSIKFLRLIDEDTQKEIILESEQYANKSLHEVLVSHLPNRLQAIVLIEEKQYKVCVKPMSDQLLFAMILSLVEPNEYKEPSDSKVILQNRIMQIHLRNNSKRLIELSQDQINAEANNVERALLRSFESLENQSGTVQRFLMDQNPYEIEGEAVLQQNQMQLLTVPAFVPSAANVSIPHEGSAQPPNKKAVGKDIAINDQDDSMEESVEKQINLAIALEQKRQSNQFNEPEEQQQQQQQQFLMPEQIAVAVTVSGDYLGGEQAQQQQQQDMFSRKSPLKPMIEDIAELYFEEVNWRFDDSIEHLDDGLEQETIMLPIIYRSALLALFENCLHLNVMEQIVSELIFSLEGASASGSAVLSVQMVIEEQKRYFYPDINDSRYSDGHSREKAMAIPFRYLNGLNSQSIAAIEYLNFVDLLDRFGNGSNIGSIHYDQNMVSMVTRVTMRFSLSDAIANNLQQNQNISRDFMQRVQDVRKYSLSSKRDILYAKTFKELESSAGANANQMQNNNNNKQNAHALSNRQFNSQIRFSNNQAATNGTPNANEKKQFVAGGKKQTLKFDLNINRSQIAEIAESQAEHSTFNYNENSKAIQSYPKKYEAYQPQPVVVPNKKSQMVKNKTLSYSGY